MYENKSEWCRQQESGLEILKTRFNNNHFREEFTNTLEKLRHQLKEHRTGNFVGAMLRYHSLRSTKFLSKWITLKNELKIGNERT